MLQTDTEKRRPVFGSKRLRDIRVFRYDKHLLVGLLSFGVALFAHQFTRTAELKFGAARFNKEIAVVETAVRVRMAAYEQILRGGIGLFQASDNVSRAAWRAYVDSLNVEEDFPGVQGIGFAELVRPPDKQAHTRGIRSQGFPDYRIWPDGARAEYSAIVYIEPFDARNRRTFGFDMMSEPMRLVAMYQARDTGRATISGKVILQQETGDDGQAGFLVYLPLYRTHPPPTTVAARRGALMGFVFSPFRMEDLMQGILGTGRDELTLKIYDGIEPSDASLSYSSGEQSASPLFSRTVNIGLNGRAWTLVFTSTPAFEIDFRGEGATFLLIAGLMITVLLVMIIHVLTTTNEKAQAIALAMTTALRGTEQKVRALNSDLERKVKQRTAELENTIAELESFAYAVSHDLRAPLRSIHGFTEALAEDYSDRLDAQGRDYTRRVRAASLRMGLLIDEILQLSRVSRGAIDRKEIDLSALAHDLVKELREGEPSRDVTVHIQPGMRAAGDKALLHAVLQNLLGNAWKFTRKTEHPVIWFGADLAHGVETYYVRDNGVGFDMEYADKLFRPFQRLHAESDFEGTGIGLATVARIIRRHGGAVRAESDPGHGTTLYFTLSSQFEPEELAHVNEIDSAGGGQSGRPGADPAVP